MLFKKVKKTKLCQCTYCSSVVKTATLDLTETLKTIQHSSLFSNLQVCARHRHISGDLNTCKAHVANVVADNRVVAPKVHKHAITDVMNCARSDLVIAGENKIR